MLSLVTLKYRMLIPVVLLVMWFNKNPQIGLPIVISLGTPVISTLLSWYMFSGANYIAFSVGLISGVVYSWVAFL
jgi:hypothetical protein